MSKLSICFIDTVGILYTGDSVYKKGLGGSEAAMIYISEELAAIGLDVTVFNNCGGPGLYNGVKYQDISTIRNCNKAYDILVVSRSPLPFVHSYWGDQAKERYGVDITQYASIVSLAKFKVLWCHDLYLQGEEYVEPLLVDGAIDEVFFLSDWQSHYMSQADHWNTAKRDYATMKKRIFQTRNGIRPFPNNTSLEEKDPNAFVFNSAIHKGMNSLIKDIWPQVKQEILEAKLTVIGGYYEGAGNAEQEKEFNELRAAYDGKYDVTFTGVITQEEVAKILSRSTFMIYPPESEETFGISTLEALYYNVVPITSRFGALEQVAIEEMSYLMDHSILDSRYPQKEKFLDLVKEAYNNKELTKQKQLKCNEIKDCVSWSMVALQWKRHFYKKFDLYLNKEQNEQTLEATTTFNHLFKSRHINLEDQIEFFPKNEEAELIIVTYMHQAENSIEKCIKSVAMQSYNNFKQFIIDDGSTDNSLEVARQTINSLSEGIRKNFIILENKESTGMARTYVNTILEINRDSAIVVLLGGKSWLSTNEFIFKYINNLYSKYDFIQEKAYPGLIAFTFDLFRKSKIEVDTIDSLIHDILESCEPSKVKCSQRDLTKILSIVEQEGTKEKVVHNNTGKKSKKILIAVPTAKYIETQTFKSIYYLEHDDDTEVFFEYFYGYNVAQVRNLIANYSILNSFTHTLWVDSDMILPKHTLTTLLAHDKKIVAGVYARRQHGLIVPEIFRDNGAPRLETHSLEDMLENKLLSVAAVGFGCVLTNTEVLTKIGYPQFEYRNALVFEDTTSEDVDFCNKAKRRGYTIYADASLKCGHIGEFIHELK